MVVYWIEHWHGYGFEPW